MRWLGYFTTCLHHLALLTPTDNSKHSPKRSLGVSHDNGRLHIANYYNLVVNKCTFTKWYKVHVFVRSISTRADNLNLSVHFLAVLVQI